MAPECILVLRLTRGGIAHEVGNPLTGIACLAQDIQRDEYYLLSQESIAAEQAIITPLILQTFSGNNGDESYENAFARLAEQYAEDVKDKLTVLVLQL